MGLALLLVALTIPPGYVEQPALEPVASWMAQRPTLVYCGENTDPALGNDYAYVGTGPIFLDTQSCASLVGWKAAKQRNETARGVFGEALLILAHEASHVSGIRDEASAECRAHRWFSAAAIRFYGFRPHTKWLRMLARETLLADARPSAC